MAVPARLLGHPRSGLDPAEGLGAYGMAATVDINPAAKQVLLELRSEPARLEQLEALFTEALKRISGEMKRLLEAQPSVDMSTWPKE